MGSQTIAPNQILNEDSSNSDRKIGKSVNEVQMQTVIPKNYASQYDPSNDFVVFGVTNQQHGGIVTIDEKVNEAELLSRVNSEDS